MKSVVLVARTWNPSPQLHWLRQPTSARLPNGDNSRLLMILPLSFRNQRLCAYSDELIFQNEEFEPKIWGRGMGGGRASCT
jgi:hypothetical protein